MIEKIKKLVQKVSEIFVSKHPEVEATYYSYDQLNGESALHFAAGMQYVLIEMGHMRKPTNHRFEYSSEHGNSKLTTEEVAKIFGDQYNCIAELAIKYGVSTPTIYSIKSQTTHRRTTSKPKKGVRNA